MVVGVNEKIRINLCKQRKRWEGYELCQQCGSPFVKLFGCIKGSGGLQREKGQNSNGCRVEIDPGPLWMHNGYARHPAPCSVHSHFQQLFDHLLRDFNVRGRNYQKQR